MVEEGVISVLSSLARGSETKTRRVCAVILQVLQFCMLLILEALIELKILTTKIL